MQHVANICPNRSPNASGHARRVQSIRQQLHLVSSHVLRRSLAHHQTCVSCRATRDLWTYSGTQVQEMNLDTLKFLHRTSYGHRNRRSIVVVVYDPDDPACQASEFEVERLATGLQHVPQVLVTKLNVRADHTPRGATSIRASPSNMTPAAHFVEGILQVQQLPAVLLYPEGAPGMVHYKGGTLLTAEGLVAALNQCQRTVLPTRPALQLQGAAQALNAPVSTTKSSSEAAVQSGTAGQQGNSVNSNTAGHVTAAAAKPQVVVAKSAQLTRHGYWSPGKMWFWGGIIAASLATVAWEKWIGPYLEQRAFQARQEARAAGKADAFDEDTNIDDLWRLRIGMQQQIKPVEQQEPIDVASSNVPSQTSSQTR